jgi:hypothetical protein
MVQFRGDWASLATELTQRLEQMRDGDLLRVGEPAAVARPKGLLRQRRSEPRRYVQFVAGPDMITGECVGSTNFGGDWSMSRDTEVALERLGWTWPLAGTSPHFRQHRRRVEAVWLAESTVAALQLLEVEPGALHLTESDTLAGTHRR